VAAGSDQAPPPNDRQKRFDRGTRAADILPVPMNLTGSPPGRVVRPPTCAGRFYPADPAALRRMVNDFLRLAREPEGPRPKAIIAPHAGYVYSGAVAASAYVHLQRDREAIHRIILLGPSHHAPFHGLATSSADAFATPLGEVGLDLPSIARIESMVQVKRCDAAHEPEHCLEVQLPFLQVTLADFAVVPLLVGEATVEEVGEVLEALWGDPGTRIVVSSDLSHYHRYQIARSLDEATALAIEALEWERLEDDQACGCRPIRGLLRQAREHGLRARMVDLRNSGDTAGPRDRVVGYGAFVFSPLGSGP
jgi:MEMO1 family protein